MLTFSDRAQEVVRSYLEASGGELTALRIAAQPGSPVAPRFELSLVATDERTADEREVGEDPVKDISDAVAFLRGF